jgi:hypothetical protein
VDLVGRSGRDDAVYIVLDRPFQPGLLRRAREDQALRCPGDEHQVFGRSSGK